MIPWVKIFTLFGFLQINNCGYTIVGVAKKQISTKCRSSIQDEIRFPISGDRHINVLTMGSNPFCKLQDGNLDDSPNTPFLGLDLNQRYVPRQVVGLVKYKH